MAEPNDGRLLMVRSMADSMSTGEISMALGIRKSTIRRYLRGADRLLNGSKQEPGSPNVLFLDIETAPLLGTMWRVGRNIFLDEQNILLPWYIISWAGKWLLKDGVFSDVITPDEAVKPLNALIESGGKLLYEKTPSPDQRICNSLWEVIEKANIVIAHNGDRFDVKKMNKRMIINELPRYSPIQTIDTLKHVRKISAFSSNKLDYLTKRAGLSQKDETKYELWKRCYFGDPVALRTMQTYNISDINALEGFFLYIKPWLLNLPNMNLYCDHYGEACPSPGCGSKNLDWTIEKYFTPAGRYKAFRCSECGSIGRSRFSDLKKKEKKNLVVAVAR